MWEGFKNYCCFQTNYRFLILGCCFKFYTSLWNFVKNYELFSQKLYYFNGYCFRKSSKTCRINDWVTMTLKNEAFSWVLGNTRHSQLSWRKSLWLYLNCYLPFKLLRRDSILTIDSALFHWRHGCGYLQIHFYTTCWRLKKHKGKRFGKGEITLRTTSFKTWCCIHFND